MPKCAAIAAALALLISGVASGDITVDAGSDQSLVSLGPVTLTGGASGMTPLDYWMADGDGPTENKLLKYSSLSGVTPVGPLRNAGGTIFGFPGDVCRNGQGTVFGWDITFRQLYTLNDTTGICTPVGGPTSLQSMTCLAFDPTRNRLYGIDAATRRLSIFNQNDGSRSNVMTLPANMIGITGLAYDSVIDRLRVYDDAAESFYTIDPIAKTVSLAFTVADPGFYDELSNLNGRVYGCYRYLVGAIWYAQLREIDFNTQAIRDIGPPMVELSAHSLLVNSVPEDVLWTVDSGPGSVSFADAKSLASSATFSIAGDYILRLTVFASPPVFDTVLIRVGRPDCNGNSVPDEADIANETSADCDEDGVPDECQPDTDGDGRIDACDGCPNDPLKLAPGVCGCGVPDTDSDNDGTPDCNDLCPNDPLKLAPGACGCGTPDTDSDNDGTPDCNDSCPNDSLKTAPGACGCGVPDTDSDNDGTPDCNDLCPNDPLKLAPGACGCGTPDTDSDNDGTPDCNDSCPNDPLKLAPGACGCGTPDTDSDNDGTPDCNDSCPSDSLKTAPGACGCGVPDTDSDDDGTPDCNDLCPNDPNKTAPGSCGCGVVDGDSDGDSVPDCDDLCPGGDDRIDCNQNGIPDACDVTPDCNQNGRPDSCDIALGASLDCNHNGVPDECDIVGGTSLDANHDGVPDECGCVGDLNGDRVVDSADLGILLGAWQINAGGDLNGDNQTDSSDLGILLGAWQTTCP
ncbi:MAG: hypothetical protein U1D55_13175 [Phycisphaerae bacterium]